MLKKLLRIFKIYLLKVKISKIYQVIRFNKHNQRNFNKLNHPYRKFKLQKNREINLNRFNNNNNQFKLINVLRNNKKHKNKEELIFQ